jgi:TrmH family RNA methyltransferase
MEQAAAYPGAGAAVAAPPLSSPQNPRVKQVVRLRDRRDRDREQLFLIEGYRELKRALDNGFPVHDLFVCAELFQGRNEPALIERYAAAGTAVHRTTEAVFRKMAYRDRPEGLLGVAPQRHRPLAHLPAAAAPLLLVAVAIEKPGNLGTILRSADATGVDGLVLCDACTDLYNPNVVRASTGTLFSVPLAEGGTPETLAWLRARGVRTLAATPHADAVYTEVDMRGPLAIIVGCEMLGLSDAWLAAADLRVRIPMLGQADSLNVATATTILLYEAVRQRGWREPAHAPAPAAAVPDARPE